MGCRYSERKVVAKLKKDGCVLAAANAMHSQQQVGCVCVCVSALHAGVLNAGVGLRVAVTRSERFAKLKLKLGGGVLATANAMYSQQQVCAALEVIR